MADKFTPLYEWLSEYRDISLNEALILSRVKMWGNRGCFESYARMAKFLKMDRSTVIRTVKNLLQKDYLIVLHQTRSKRILYFNADKFTIPLSKSSGRVPPVAAKGSGNLPPAEAPTGGTVLPEVVAQCHPTIYSQNNRRNIGKLSESMTIQDMSRAELKQRKQKLSTQCKLLLNETKK
jgi:hypothetical protein